MCIFVCVHADLWPLCGRLTTAMCCLVFVVSLEYAQALGLSVCRCGLAVRPKAWLRAQGWLYQYDVKVTCLKKQPELRPPRVLSYSLGPSYAFRFLTYDQYNNEKLDFLSLSFSLSALWAIEKKINRAIIRCPWEYKDIMSIGLCCLFHPMLL